MRMLAVVALALASLASPALAETGQTLGLPHGADAEIKTVQYTCQNHDPVTVQYINAAPNYLAILPLEGHNLVFSSVLAASGTKYVSGQYELFG